ncbi:unnamed protein product, partial [Gongylonema pulchrum]
MANPQQQQQQPRKLSHPKSSVLFPFVNNDTKTMIDGINMRLNDIDLKLSFILELLARRLPEKLPSQMLS